MHVFACVCVCVYACECVRTRVHTCAFAVHAQSLTLCSEGGGNVFLEHPACPAAAALTTVAHTIQEQ